MRALAALALAALVATPALAAPAPAPVRTPLIDPVTLKVNEAAQREIEARAKARDVAWDSKIKRTMSGVCKGC